MLSILLVSTAFAGGSIALDMEGGAVLDPVVSSRTYLGLSAGPRVGLDVGHAWAVRLDVGLRGGRLSPAGLRRRVFTSTGVDSLTGEERTGALVASRLDLRVDLAVAVEREVRDGLFLGATLDWTTEYATGMALGLWAYSTAQVGPGLTWTSGRDVHIQVRASADLLGVVTRFPWSADPIQPGKGLVGGFFASGTRISGPWSHAALRGSMRLRPAQSGLTGWVRAEVGHDWDPAPMTWARASVAVGWSR